MLIPQELSKLDTRTFIGKQFNLHITIFRNAKY